MSTFSRLLNSLVHQKDIAVYPMTQYCGIDRTLMYKYLNGKDYPREQAIVDRMADFMRLSPSESEELLTAWQIEKIGWKEWNSRRNVEDFLLNLPDISDFSKISKTSGGSSAKQTTNAPSASNSLQELQGKHDRHANGSFARACYPDCRALPTQTALNNVISQVIMDEIQKENGRLCLMLQPDYDYLFHLLMGLGEYEHQLPIDHILCLGNSSQSDKAVQDHNLVYLQKILPLYVRALDYNVYYYYDAVESHFSNLNGLSCLILTSSCAITCTSDFQSGILYGKPEIVQMLQKHFDACREKCSPFFSPIHSIEDTCEMILKFFSENDEYYSLQPEPCIIPFLTPDLVERIIRPDLPGRAELISLLNDFFRRRKDSVFTENYHIFHTTPGLRRFMETGRSYEIPEDLYVPFSPEDRKLLLYRLSPFFPERYHLLRGPLENLPQNFHLWANASNGYMMFTNRKKETVYLLFTEPGLLTSFIDYLKNLEEKYLYTGEECHHLIEELLEHV